MKLCDRALAQDGRPLEGELTMRLLDRDGNVVEEATFTAESTDWQVKEFAGEYATIMAAEGCEGSIVWERA